MPAARQGPGLGAIELATAQLQHAVCSWRAVEVDMAGFVVRWMEDLSYDVRKSYSYWGYLRYLTPPEMRPEYDPGNAIYTRALRLIMNNDGIFLLHNWNEVTCGDIIESILGYHWLTRNTLPKDMRKAMNNLILMIEYLTLAIVYYGRATGWAGFDDYEKWTRSWTHAR